MLLLKQQMGARQGQSTNLALELLTEQVHTVWNARKYVASLLSLDISGAFDTVVPICLLDVLQKRGLPGWIVRWVRSFLTDRKSTLLFSGLESELRQIPGGAP